MRIRMRNTIAGPKVNADAGQVVDVPEKQAVNLVDKGYAEYCKETTVETAVIETDAETEAIRIGKAEAKAEAAAKVKAEKAAKAEAKKRAKAEAKKN